MNFTATSIQWKKRIAGMLLVVIVALALLPTVGALASSISHTRGYASLGGSDTSQWLGGSNSASLLTGAIPGTGQDPFGNSTSPVWLLVRVLPYIFAAIGILVVLGLVASGNPLEAVILAAIVIVVTIVGLALIGTFIP